MSNFVSTEIEGVKIFNLKVLGDDRGHFFEAFRASWLTPPRGAVQWNISRSSAGVVRGLHFHRLQSDYWFVPDGHLRVALADLRTKSPTYKKAFCVELKTSERQGLLIPPGVLHGYRLLQDSTVMYLVDVEYTGKDEYGVRWNDPALGLPKYWYEGPAPTLSNRDATAPFLKDAEIF